MCDKWRHHYVVGFIEHMKRMLFTDFKSKDVYVQAENQVELHIPNLHVSQRLKQEYDL